MRIRRAALAAVAPLLLTACGDDKPPIRSKDIKPGPTCSTQGTIEAQPVSGLQEAVAPYRKPGEKLRIAERFGGTAEVELLTAGSEGVPSRVTLVRTAQGWVVTSVVRC